jgi:hypothetical protein
LLYCAQRPFRNVAEISYLLYRQDRPWETVRLLAPNSSLLSRNRSRESARILDRLTTSRDQIRSGLVNINTLHAPVLAAALHRAPLERWPGDGRRRVSAEVAVRLGSDWFNSMPEGGLENVSGIAGLEGLDTEQVTAVAGDGALSPNKFLAESAFRNSFELLGTHDTLYTIFMNTRVFPKGYDPDEPGAILDTDDLVVAQQRALAVVWRDPVTGRSRVISFIWLPDFD